MCVFVCGFLLDLMSPTIISFPSLWAEEIPVIYMAQVQPDSNMSDILLLFSVVFCLFYCDEWDMSL